MTLQVTPDQDKTLSQGKAVLVTDPTTRQRFAVLPENAFVRLLDEAQDERLQAGWRKLAGRGVAIALEE